MKQGVNIEEMERINNQKDKSDAEGYLSKICQKLEYSQNVKLNWEKRSKD